MIMKFWVRRFKSIRLGTRPFPSYCMAMFYQVFQQIIPNYIVNEIRTGNLALKGILFNFSEDKTNKVHIC